MNVLNIVCNSLHHNIIVILNKKCIFFFTDNQSDWKPIRIYQIPLQTLSRSTLSTCSQRRCPSPGESEIISSAPPTTDKSFLSVEPHRALSRSCSSSPTPTPTTLIPPRFRK